MEPITLKPCVYKSTRTAEFDESTFLIASIRKMNCLLSSSCSSQFRSNNLP